MYSRNTKQKTRTTPFVHKGHTFPLVGTFTGAPENGVLIFGGRSTQIIATQEYREDINTLELEFDLWRESTGNSGQLEVGVMSNPYDASTFIPVHNLTSLIVIDNGYFSNIFINNKCCTSTKILLSFLINSITF